MHGKGVPGARWRACAIIRGMAGRRNGTRRRPRRVASAQAEVLGSAAIGLVAAALVALFTHAAVVAALVGWVAASAAYTAWVWATIWRMDADATKPLAERQDPTRAAADLLALSAAVASLVAVGFVLARGATTRGTDQLLYVGLALASVVVSWLLVHTVYTLRYARIYYTGEDGGVDFNQAERPDFGDFAYLAFTIGMTFQVSDTALTSREIRRAALGHSFLSYLFGTGILAMTVNLVASITTK
jgi:uncharacterized membrane protein